MTARNTRLTTLALIPIFIMLMTGSAFAQKPCCQRSCTVPPMPMPDGHNEDYSSFVISVIGGSLIEASIDEPDCPVGFGFKDFEWMKELHKIIDGMIRAGGSGNPTVRELQRREEYGDYDYIFVGHLSVSNITEVVEPWYDSLFEHQMEQTLIGDWELTIELVEPFHGNTLKDVHVTWTGSIVDCIGKTPDGHWWHYVTDAEKEFLPLGKLLYDYERTPENCTATPEKDSLEACEETTIRVENFTDSLGRTPPAFQRIVVTPQHGEILNGFNDGKAHVFVIGEDGVVEIEYKAPETCGIEEDTVIIENTCNFNGPLGGVLGRHEMARVRFKISNRLPEHCKITPQRNTVEAGTSINVRITEIVDKTNKPMQPNEKLMLKADKGKIENGMSYRDYKIFEVGEGTLDVRYRAPNDCNITADTLRVFSCCMRGDKEIEIVPEKQIRKKKLGVECKYEWTGSLTFTQKSDFSCDIDSTNEPITTYLIAGESQTQMGAIDICSEKIDLERRGAAMLTADRMEASGYVNCSKNIKREKGGNDSKRNDWHKEVRTVFASEHCQLTEDNLSISISKDVRGTESTVDRLSKQILEAARTGDLERVEKLKKQMKEAVHGGDDNSNQLSIHINIGIDCMTNAQKTYTFQQYDGIEDEMVQDKNDHGSEDIRIGTPIALSLDGTYTKSENGAHTITGYYSKSGTVESGMGLGHINCPSIQSSINCNLTLTRRRITGGQ